MKTLILSDFSKTFTAGDMPTTYSVFAKSGLLGPEYTAARDALFTERYHFETEGNAVETQRWFLDHVQLFVDYGLTQEFIDRIVADDVYFKPRAGIAEFLAYIRENHIALRIVTSGVSNFAEAFFRVRGYGLEGIEIQGNRLIMENGKAVGVDRSSGINTIDKSDHHFSTAGYDQIITLGDNKEDTTTATGSNVRSFGFTDEDRGFDVKLGKNASFADLITQLDQPMQQSYVPSINPEDLCDELKLCSVRKHDNEYFVGKKNRYGNLTEVPFSDIVNSDTYEGSPLIRTYSSGHVFLDETHERVWLLSTEKDGKIQHQFTGGSPMENINKEVFHMIDGVMKMHLERVEDNADIRTYNRTGAKVTEVWNEIPIVDWALLENQDETGATFWKLVYLTHWIVKKYEWELSYKDGVEYVTGGAWYVIDDLPNIPNVAPNAYIVASKARETLL